MATRNINPNPADHVNGASRGVNPRLDEAPIRVSRQQAQQLRSTTPTPQDHRVLAGAQQLPGNIMESGRMFLDQLGQAQLEAQRQFEAQNIMGAPPAAFDPFAGMELLSGQLGVADIPGVPSGIQTPTGVTGGPVPFVGPRAVGVGAVERALGRARGAPGSLAERARSGVSRVPTSASDLRTLIRGRPERAQLQLTGTGTRGQGQVQIAPPRGPPRRGFDPAEREVIGSGTGSQVSSDMLALAREQDAAIQAISRRNQAIQLARDLQAAQSQRLFGVAQQPQAIGGGLGLLEQAQQPQVGQLGSPSLGLAEDLAAPTVGLGGGMGGQLQLQQPGSLLRPTSPQLMTGVRSATPPDTFGLEGFGQRGGIGMERPLQPTSTFFGQRPLVTPIPRPPLQTPFPPGQVPQPVPRPPPMRPPPFRPGQVPPGPPPGMLGLPPLGGGSGRGRGRRRFLFNELFQFSPALPGTDIRFGPGGQPFILRNGQPVSLARSMQARMQPRDAQGRFTSQSNMQGMNQRGMMGLDG